MFIHGSAEKYHQSHYYSQWAIPWRTWFVRFAALTWIMWRIIFFVHFFFIFWFWFTRENRVATNGMLLCAHTIPFTEIWELLSLQLRAMLFSYLFILFFSFFSLEMKHLCLSQYIWFIRAGVFFPLRNFSNFFLCRFSPLCITRMALRNRAKTSQQQIARWERVWNEYINYMMVTFWRNFITVWWAQRITDVFLALFSCE